MSAAVDTAKLDAINEINTINAGSADPTDKGAYDLTMYGIDQISGITGHVFDTLGNASVIGDTSAISAQTGHASAGTTLASAPIDSFGSLFNHIVTDPGQFMQTNSTGFMVLGAVFTLLLGKFFFMPR